MTSQPARADTKQKLASIIDGFSSFDSEMKIGTRVGGGPGPMCYFIDDLGIWSFRLWLPVQQRREQDEQRLAVLRTDIVKIDKALTAEIKRGLERNKAIQVVSTVYCPPPDLPGK